MKILPPMDEIPSEFRDFNRENRWTRLVGDWFFRGIHIKSAKPKEGVDADKAFRAVRACLGSFEPKHEHKHAGCAFLLSEWFESIEYEVGHRREDS